jgi:hypothetical protein
MKSFATRLGLVLGVLVIAIGGFFVAMSFHDGPLAIISGGPFRSGDVIAGLEPDWSVIQNRETIEIQLLEPPRSRTTWLAVVDHKLYIASAYMNSTVGKIWKQWPHHAMTNGAALIRIDGRIYERQLRRINDADIANIVGPEFARKYQLGMNADSVSTGDVWLFELAPRPD